MCKSRVFLVFLGYSGCLLDLCYNTDWSYHISFNTIYHISFRTIERKTEMKNKLLLLTFSILLISLTSAINIYSGESVTLELDKPFAYYSIVGNSTPINLEITQEGNNITIVFDKYTQNDTFEIVFFDKEKETITIYSGGGSTKYDTKYIDRNITKYIEVPIYNETIKYVENYGNVDEPIETIPLDVWIILGVITAIFIIWIILLYIPLKKKQFL